MSPYVGSLRIRALHPLNRKRWRQSLESERRRSGAGCNEFEEQRELHLIHVPRQDPETLDLRIKAGVAARIARVCVKIIHRYLACRAGYENLKLGGAEHG